MVETPDEVIVHEVVRCEHCKGNLANVEAKRVVKRQVFDLPPMQLQVTEHQAEVKECPCCANQTRAEFPEDVKTPVQYGERVLAHAAYLNMYHLIPLKRVRE